MTWSRPAWPWNRHWKIRTTVPSVHDIPDKIRRRTAVLVQSNTYPKWLVFDCPCVERHRVMINLDPHNRPFWTVLAPSPLTVVPSVDQKKGATRCHYIIRAGRIGWV
ncbi:DUF6527 family protein [Streptomyces phaeochromogenes]|uniref:DUF6527 family protein n=1 Tax=Streptomyces phaeochromogenes TaxID=1923 RepID=UPI0037177C28